MSNGPNLKILPLKDPLLRTHLASTILMFHFLVVVEPPRASKKSNHQAFCPRRSRPGDDAAGDVGGFQLLLTKALKQEQGHLPLATAFTTADGRIVGDHLGQLWQKSETMEFTNPEKILDPENSPVFD